MRLRQGLARDDCGRLEMRHPSLRKGPGRLRAACESADALSSD